MFSMTLLPERRRRQPHADDVADQREAWLTLVCFSAVAHFERPVYACRTKVVLAMWGVKLS